MMLKFLKFSMLLTTGILLMCSCSKQEKVYPSNASPVSSNYTPELTLISNRSSLVNTILAPLVTTVAGNGVKGFADGPANTAMFESPAGVVTDAAGNLYVADRDNRRIRKITPSGVVSTLTGTAQDNIIFADGPLHLARFSTPTGLAIDASGNIYVADAGINRIRKITTAGEVITIAGSGPTGSNGGGFADGPAHLAKFYFPSGVAVDAAGVVYVADYANNRIRKIFPAGFVTTLAGSGVPGYADGPGATAKFILPIGVAVDASGNVFVAEDYGHRIRKITPTGVVSTVAGNGVGGFVDGTGTAAQFNRPQGISIDASGNLYVPDGLNQRIRKVTPAGVVSTLAGNGTMAYADGTAAFAQFGGATAVTVDASGDLYVADFILPRIRKISTTATEGVRTVAGNGVAAEVDGAFTNAQFNSPGAVATDASGNIYVADEVSSRIRKITPSGTVSTLAGGIKGFADGTGGSARFNTPTGIAADASGNVYVADQINHRIRKITPAGVVSTFAGNGTRGAADGQGTDAQFNYPFGVAVDAVGNVYVADANNNKIRKITPSGMVSTLAGSGLTGFADGAATVAKFSSPIAVAVDASGNVYVADKRNNRIRKITPAGVVSTLAGNGTAGFANGVGTSAQFNFPYGVAVDASGNVFVTDANNNSIRKITAAGVVSTPAGNGSADYVDGKGIDSRFNFPFGIAVDASGALYIGDQNNNRIRVMVQ